jgi:LysR family glycine cleavage system transcriptional activator
MFDRPSPHAAKQRLRLATTASFARFWLTRRLAELRSISGAQIVAIETGVEPILFEQGKIDVAIRYGRGNWPGAQAILLGLERTFPVASPAFARQLKIWDAAAIAHAPLIANAFVSWRAWLNAAQLSSMVALNVVLETGDSSFSLDAAAAGVGVALARARLARGMLARGELIALSNIAIDDGYAYHLVWPADGRRKSAVSALAEWLAQEFEEESSVLGFPAATRTQRRKGENEAF